MKRNLITCGMLAAELGLNVDVITFLSWDMACQDENLAADFERFLAAPFNSLRVAPFGSWDELAVIEISEGLAGRVRDRLDAAANYGYVFGALHSGVCPDCGWWGDDRDACDDPWNPCPREAR